MSNKSSIQKKGRTVIVQVDWFKGLLEHAKKTHKLLKKNKEYKVACELELSGFIGYAESAKYIIENL